LSEIKKEEKMEEEKGLVETKLKVRPVKKEREKKYRDYPTVVDNSTAAHDFWEPIVHLGLWAIKGHQIVKGPWGGGTVEQAKKRPPREFMVIDRASFAFYSHSYGLVSPFFQGLLKGKLTGTKCPKCGTVYCPPRAHCWNPECKVADCFDNWVDLPLTGIIHTFTVQCLAAAPFEHMLPFSMGWVQVDGADTTLPMLLHIRPKEIFIGKKVNIEFMPKKSRKGDLMDLYAVAAVPGEKPPEWACLQKDTREMESVENSMKATLKFIKDRYGVDNSPQTRGW
jgi:uncharacterized OB-fold protein